MVCQRAPSLRFLPPRCIGDRRGITLRLVRNNRLRGKGFQHLKHKRLHCLLIRFLNRLHQKHFPFIQIHRCDHSLAPLPAIGTLVLSRPIRFTLTFPFSALCAERAFSPAALTSRRTLVPELRPPNALNTISTLR